ncbi:tetraacyldisaccharide 4'-kinase [Saccharospirillum sp. HFRX-1]|uniref:tetraacyldisaccharide 4'-kinase n=1 Tax=unclassified Saccharospirillum TaxID=2633430 RepID=UPI0037180848
MRFWYQNTTSWPARLLTPFTWLMASIVGYRLKRRFRGQYGAPVLVVGNLAVGGTGKSPAIQALVRHLQAQGLKCGVISRGYGGKAPSYPWLVNREDSAEVCGDEPLLLARSLDCPVVVDPDRDQAARFLMAQHQPDVVISDDGLQHYRLGRNFELVMIDGRRGFGNGRLLPAGPLREPVSRLTLVDWVVAREQQPAGITTDAVLTLNPEPPTNRNGQILAPGSEVDACAGIGNPEAFFQQLSDLGYSIKQRWTPGDHQPLPREALTSGERPMVITEKDAIKLPGPLPEHCYVVRLQPALPEELLSTIEQALRKALQ